MFVMQNVLLDDILITLKYYCSLKIEVLRNNGARIFFLCLSVKHLNAYANKRRLEREIVILDFHFYFDV